MYSLLKSLFFLLSPEKAHYLAMDLLQAGLKIPGLASLIKSSYKPKNQTIEKGIRNVNLSIYFTTTLLSNQSIWKETIWMKIGKVHIHPFLKHFPYSMKLLWMTPFSCFTTLTPFFLSSNNSLRITRRSNLF